MLKEKRVWMAPVVIPNFVPDVFVITYFLDNDKNIYHEYHPIIAWMISVEPEAFESIQYPIIPDGFESDPVYCIEQTVKGRRLWIFQSECVVESVQAAQDYALERLKQRGSR